MGVCIAASISALAQAQSNIPFQASMVGRSSLEDALVTPSVSLPEVMITNISPSNGFCPGGNVDIDISAFSISSGNVFTAQLSSASGSFANPKIIGTLGSATSGTINAVIPPTAGAGTHYRIRVVASAPGVTSNDNGTDLTIYAKPTANAIAISPASSLTICAGSSTPFSTPAHPGYQYQWKLNGTNIPGATNDNITASNGGLYAVTVTNDHGCTLTSGTRKLTLDPMPVGTFTVSNAAGGNKKLYANQSVSQYQWHLNGNPISGATNRAYTATMSGNYHVVVTRMICTTVGSPIAITVGTTARTLSSNPELAIQKQATFTIYPNPAATNATILIQDASAGDWDVRIVDVTGRLMEQGRTSAGVEYAFGSALAPGIYTIVVSSGSSRLAQQWVKQ